MSTAALREATPRRAAEILRLEVTDPEVVDELRRHPEGEARDRFAAQALRIGVLALRAAGGQVDAAAIREEGTRLVAAMREALSAKGAELTGEMSRAFAQYLDPRSGAFAQRVESLVKRDGELERLLRQQVGPENSTLAQSLAEHVGERSPLFRMLSPSDAQGVRAQVQATLQKALEEQRDAVLGQFSLDRQDSALSRLVSRLQVQQGELRSDLRAQVETVVQELSLDKPDSGLSRLVHEVEAAQAAITEQFSMDNADSALSRMSRLLDQTSDQIRANLTLDDEGSALSRLKRELIGTIDGLARGNEEFQREMRAAVAALDARKKAEGRGTVHGLDFEDRLGSWLAAEAQRAGDVHEAVGGVAGEVPRSKVGDHVVELGADCAARGARVVWEAKEAQGYTPRKALAELDEARRNRRAQLGVFVFSRKSAPEGLPPFFRAGNDLLVVWDAEDPASDVVLTLAYSFVRALAVREASEAEAHGEVAAAIEKSLRGIEKRVATLSDIETWATTVENKGRDIGRAAARAREELKEHVELLNAQLLALKSAT
jgi:hypothetical protein